MITFVRTASIAPGKVVDAVRFAHTVAELLKSKFGAQMGVSMPIGGNPNRIAWVSTFASLAELEEGFQKFASDPEYLNLVASGAANFLPGSVHDEIWRSI